MADERIEKLAKLCVHYSVALQPKEKVLIRGSDLAFPLINEIYKQCLLSDAYPSILPILDVEYTFFKYAKPHQLRFVSPLDRFRIENTDVLITAWCHPNPKGLSSIDPSKIKTHRAARRDLAETFNARAAEGTLKWTLLPFPINAQAQEANMSLSEYEDFVYSSCFVDKKDPIAEWQKLSQQQQKLCDFLGEIREIRVTGEDTDLCFRVDGRTWINSDGKRNMPSGEVFTAPLEKSASGTIRFTFPGIYAGKEVEDIKLTFAEGKVVKASAAKGNDLLQQVLEIDGADHIGETAIGTNYGITRFTKNMLFDEKMGGTIHLALGNSYPETGGLNKSAIHWDLLKDMKEEGEIYGDGTLFYRKGKFLV
jgi:aminopeptidase